VETFQYLRALIINDSENTKMHNITATCLNGNDLKFCLRTADKILELLLKCKVTLLQ